MIHSVKILDRYLIVDEDTGCASLADEAPVPAAADPTATYRSMPTAHRRSVC